MVKNKRGGSLFSLSWFGLVMALLIAVFGLVLVYAAAGELANDEIWSLDNVVKYMHSPSDVLSIKTANNHLLNSLWIYYVCKSKSPLIINIRMLSIIAGVLSLILIALIARAESGKTASLIALLLAGFSYPLTTYFSEARGYALAICLALSAYYALQKYLKTSSKIALIAFWLSSILGFMAHSTFLIASVAYAALTVYVPNRTLKWRQNINIKGFAVHLPVWVFFVCYYHRVVAVFDNGDADVMPFLDVFGQLCTYLCGVRDCTAGRIIAVIAACLFLFFAFKWALKKTTLHPLFYLTIIAIAPAMVIAAAQPEYLHFRFVIIIFPFIYILAASFIADLIKKKGAERALFAALLLIYAVSNASMTSNLLGVGRCPFKEMFAYLINKRPQDKIEIGSCMAGGFLLRHLRYYSSRLDLSRVEYYQYYLLPSRICIGLAYSGQGSKNGEQPIKRSNHEPDYFIMLGTEGRWEGLDKPYPPDEFLALYGLKNWRLERIFTAAPLTSYRIHLYRNTRAS